MHNSYELNKTFVREGILRFLFFFFRCVQLVLFVQWVCQFG